MSTKYISQQSDNNFIYPNYDPKQYDVEIIHEINNNSVSGTVTNFSATTVNSTGITISFDYTWSLNGAEPYIRSDNTTMSVFSVHIMAAGQSYFKPWRLVNSLASSNITGTTYSGTTVDTFYPSELGLDSFTNGTYYYEIRMIGKRAVYPICGSFVVSTIIDPTPTPTPTPTVTPTHGTPTPTPTPSPTPGSIYTSGVTINVTDTGWIKYTTSSGDTYYQCTSLGSTVLPDCLVCSSINYGYPFADLASWTLVNCGSPCSGPPPTTPTPTPTNPGYYYYKLTACSNYQTYYSQAYPVGTFNSGERVQGGTGVFYVVSGSQTGNPGGTLYTVTATGFYSCP
jgi:hypothetical protein